MSQRIVSRRVSRHKSSMMNVRSDVGGRVADQRDDVTRSMTSPGGIGIVHIEGGRHLLG